jgi:hypothetical protein
VKSLVLPGKAARLFDAIGHVVRLRGTNGMACSRGSAIDAGDSATKLTGKSGLSSAARSTRSSFPQPCFAGSSCTASVETGHRGFSGWWRMHTGWSTRAFYVRTDRARGRIRLPICEYLAVDRRRRSSSHSGKMTDRSNRRSDRPGVEERWPRLLGQFFRIPK